MKTTFISFIWFITMMTSLSAFAGAPQQIIVQFETEISEARKAEVNQQITDIVKVGFSLAESSNEIRWVIKLGARVDKDELERMIKALKEVNDVRYAELDAILQIF